MRHFDAVDAWINNVAYSHSKSKGTEQSYRHGLNLFCDFTGSKPDQILQEYDDSDEKAFKRKMIARGALR